MLLSVLLKLAVALTPLVLSRGQKYPSTISCQCDHYDNRSVVSRLTCRRNQLDELECAQDAVANLPLGYKWLPGYGLYSLYRTARSFESATTQCSLDGNRLAILQNETQVASLSAKIADEPVHLDAFIGVVANQAGGKWIGVDGSPAPYLPWADGYPLSGNGSCVKLNSDGQVFNSACEHQEAYLCERPISSLHDGFTWSEEAARFYRYHDTYQTYEDAKDICEADGATLVIPDTIARVQAIIPLIVEANHVWTGFTDSMREGNYSTDVGRLMADMEFQNWGYGHPHCGKWLECVLLYPEGYYVDAECNAVHRFACEIAP